MSFLRLDGAPVLVSVMLLLRQQLWMQATRRPLLLLLPPLVTTTPINNEPLIHSVTHKARFRPSETKAHLHRIKIIQQLHRYIRRDPERPEEATKRAMKCKSALPGERGRCVGWYEG